GMVAVCERWMARDPDQRFQEPGDRVQARAPWTQTNIAPPAEAEMPQLSLAAMSSEGNTAPKSPEPGRAKPQASSASKSWQIPASPTSPPPPSRPPPTAQPAKRTDAALRHQT